MVPHIFANRTRVVVDDRVAVRTKLVQIRQYATIIGEQIVAPLFPKTWKAFQDYRLGAMRLSALDIAVAQSVVTTGKPVWPDGWTKKSRERAECVAKLAKLGLVVED